MLKLPSTPLPTELEAVTASLEVSDDVLLEAALQGCRESEGALFERHRAAIFAYMCKLCRDPHSAEDAVQNAFLTAHVKLDTFKGDANLRTWLTTIARNNYLSARRKVDRIVSIFLEGRVQIADMLQDTKCIDPAEIVLDTEQKTLLTRAIRFYIQELSEDHRTVLREREFKGKSYGEIAEDLQISVGTVRSRLARARSEIAQKLIAHAQAQGVLPNPNEAIQSKSKQWTSIKSLKDLRLFNTVVESL